MQPCLVREGECNVHLDDGVGRLNGVVELALHFTEGCKARSMKIVRIQ